ncbi:MAG: thiamine phosphate synthase [Deltaproteobacteria bacterium]
MHISDFSLYLITDRLQTCGRALEDVVWQALDGGVRAVQLREKSLSSAELYSIAVKMRRLTADYGARLIINDRIDIARAVAADGVQIGVNSLPVTAARSILMPGNVLIYSAHSIEEAVCAQRDGVDFVTFGPVYHTPSKASFGDPCGIRKLSEAVRALDIPVIALGGIKLENSYETLSAGCRGIAVISAVLAAPDPRDAAASLLKKIEEHVQNP